MRFTSLDLENWRNFRRVSVVLESRVFLVGPNACGKSNLLDVFRFLRDIAEPEGGLQSAIRRRGGISPLRSLFARRLPDITIDVGLRDTDQSRWRYRIVIGESKKSKGPTPRVVEEVVEKDGVLLLRRPDKDDSKDPERLAQTHLEQVSANASFRPLAAGLSEVRYLHVVPQLIRNSDRFRDHTSLTEAFGGSLLGQMSRLQKDNKRTFDARLRVLNEALRVAVPRFKELRLDRDEDGRPHLLVLNEHWRPKAGWQNEDQLSDGTLRLVGLLWVLMSGDGPLLLEEPELSLHEDIVAQLPGLLWRATRKSMRQTIISTHSKALLTDPGISAGEVLMLTPTKEQTDVRSAATLPDIQNLLQSGLSAGEAILPFASPPTAEHLQTLLRDR